MSDYIQDVAAGALLVNACMGSGERRPYNSLLNEWQNYARSLEAHINELENILRDKTVIEERRDEQSRLDGIKLWGREAEIDSQKHRIKQLENAYKAANVSLIKAEEEYADAEMNGQDEFYSKLAVTADLYSYEAQLKALILEIIQKGDLTKYYSLLPHVRKSTMDAARALYFNEIGDYKPDKEFNYENPARQQLAEVVESHLQRIKSIAQPGADPEQ